MITTFSLGSVDLRIVWKTLPLLIPIWNKMFEKNELKFYALIRAEFLTQVLVMIPGHISKYIEIIFI